MAWAAFAIAVVAVKSDKELDSMPVGAVVRSSCFVVG